MGGAILATVGCSSEAPVYPGGPAGPAATLHVSSSLFVVQVGGTPATVGARVEDVAGNPTADAVSFASCDAAKVAVSAGGAIAPWSSSATISGVSLGAACVTASAAGMTDTIRVRMAPGSMVITGPDSVFSGSPATYGVELYAVDGSPLTLSADFPMPELKSLNTLRLGLTAADPLTYDAAGQQPGTVVLQISTNTDFGSVTASKTVVVVPGPFTGTFSATSGAIQTIIKVTPGPGITFDADVRVRIGPSYYGENWDGTAAGAPLAVFPDSLLFIVPATIALGTYDTFVLDQGPGQIASKTSFTVVAGGTTTVNRQLYPGANTPGTRLENKPLPVHFPVVFPDPAVGTTSYYTVTPTTADLQYTMLLRFPCPGDLDIQIIDGGFTAFLGDRGGETLACPEATVWRTVKGGFNFIRIQNFEAVPMPSDMSVFPGCVAIKNGDGVSTQQTSSSSNWRASGC